MINDRNKLIRTCSMTVLSNNNNLKNHNRNNCVRMFRMWFFFENAKRYNILMNYFQFKK